MSKPSHTCSTSMAELHKHQWKTFRLSILIIVSDRLSYYLHAEIYDSIINLNSNPYYLSFSGVYCNAVRAGSRRCVFHGLQLSFVCSTGFCYHSVLLWWQTGLWMILLYLFLVLIVWSTFSEMSEICITKSLGIYNKHNYSMQYIIDLFYSFIHVVKCKTFWLIIFVYLWPLNLLFLLNTWGNSFEIFYLLF